MTYKLICISYKILQTLLIRIISILLLFSISVQMMSKTLILLSFAMNQSHIAEEWCINRLKPELMCGGKCYLSEKLEETQQKENTPFSLSQLLPIKAEYIPLSTQGILLISPIFYKVKALFIWLASYSYDFITTLFRPPD